MRGFLSLLLLVAIAPAAHAVDGSLPARAETAPPASVAETRTATPPVVEPIQEVRQPAQQVSSEKAAEATAATQPPRGWWWTVAAIVAAGIILAVIL